MINELIKLATHLDKKGLHKEADYLDTVIKSITAGRDIWFRWCRRGIRAALESFQTGRLMFMTIKRKAVLAQIRV